MGRSTSLHPDAAGRRLGEERKHLASAQLARHRRLALTLDRMHLKKVLRQVDPNPDKGLHGRLPYPRPALVTPWHLMPFGRGRPHHHYGLFANANRANNIALARRLLAVPDPTPSSRASDHAENGRDDEDWNACPCCGGRMIIVEAFEPGCQPRFWPVPSIGLDSS